MAKKTFKQLVEDFKTQKPLKKLELSTKLPYVFDLHWDLKWGFQILENTYYLNNKLVQAELAKAGFDLKNLIQEKN